ncbi:VOC family protein [Coralloluteibacterium thermophilus]|uniref:VOC family protein n=1 Tax=Coralloluteibacterium thermophilum TaxID=2707049 RepID=A0ABV9NJ99_9GAMM
MKVRTTVLCLPVADLHKTLDFYRGTFGLCDAQIDGGMVALEIPNLSLFLMTKGSYESYTKKANRDALMPGSSAPAVISCAVETKEDVDQALRKAEVCGGASAGPAAIDPESGGYIGYVTDPDGHLWELVCPYQK